MLNRLLYLSFATSPMGEEDLRSLLEASKRNNEADDITGLLLYHDGNFLQVLEGPQEELAACFERIRADPRHSGIITALYGPARKRIFRDWSMAYIPFDALNAEQQKGFFDLRHATNSGRTYVSQSDPKIAAFVEVFLSSFSDLVPPDNS